MYMNLNPDVPRKLMMGPYLHIAPDIGFAGAERIDHLHEIVQMVRPVPEGTRTAASPRSRPSTCGYGVLRPAPRSGGRAPAGYWRSEVRLATRPGRRDETLYPASRRAADATRRPAAGEGGSVSYEYDPAVGVSTMGLITGFGADVGPAPRPASGGGRARRYSSASRSRRMSR